MRKALSIAAGPWSETRLPKKLLISRLKLISPRLIVTGSISSSTRLTFLAAPIHLEGELEGRVAQVPGRDRQLDHGADEDADRVGVDPVVPVKGRASTTSTPMIVRFQKSGEIAKAPKRS